jgi:transposase
MKNTMYLSLDLHARHCVLGQMDSRGHYLGEERFSTSAAQLIEHVAQVEAHRKLLSFEEGPMAQWVGRILAPYVEEILICDPRQNPLISRNAHKRDESDTCALCRLHRLGELSEVYHPQDDQRAIFKASSQHYLALVRAQTALMQQIKAKYRVWGVPEVDGQRVYSKRGRGEYLDQIKVPPVAHQLERLYALMDANRVETRSAFKEMLELGRCCPEIREFEKVPGIGPVGAHVFDAFIQTPHRFATKAQLWRYCRLSITDRSSDGKPLGYRKLERAGVGQLKALSYHAWQSACAKPGRPNEVRAFYQHSLQATHNPTHARLNTQRKVLEVLWTIWKNKEVYDKAKFSHST